MAVFRLTGRLRNEHVATIWQDSEDDVPEGRTDEDVEAIAQLVAAAACLRDSLLAVEWAGSDEDADGDLVDTCPNCGATFGDPEKGLTGLHFAGCELRDSLDAALGVTSPRVVHPAHEKVGGEAPR